MVIHIHGIVNFLLSLLCQFYCILYELIWNETLFCYYYCARYFNSACPTWFVLGFPVKQSTHNLEWIIWMYPISDWSIYYSDGKHAGPTIRAELTGSKIVLYKFQLQWSFGETLTLKLSVLSCSLLMQIYQRQRLSLPIKFLVKILYCKEMV